MTVTVKKKGTMFKANDRDLVGLWDTINVWIGTSPMNSLVKYGVLLINDSFKFY
jgi:hypothetical protein